MKFRTLAREWLDEVHAKQVKDSTSVNVGGEISRHLFDSIGDTDVNQLSPKTLLDILLEIGSDSPHLAKRLCQRLNAIFVYAGVMGYTDKNPAYRLNNFLPKNKTKHHNHISDAEQLSRLLKDVDKERGISPATKAAFGYWCIHRLGAVRPALPCVASLTCQSTCGTSQQRGQKRAIRKLSRCLSKRLQC